MNERYFSYHTLPDYEETNDRSMEDNYFINSGQFTPCPYCMQMAQASYTNSREQIKKTNRQMNAENVMIQQFLNDDGQVDIQKMLQTIGQFADTVQQVSPVIKQINELVKSFRA